MPLVHFTKPEQWTCCKTGQTAQTCWSTRLVKRAPWSLWSSRRGPHVEIIFSKRTLAIEQIVPCLQGKASVQCENIQIMTKAYLYPQDGESCIKFIFQNFHGPLGSLKHLGVVRTVVPGLYFRQLNKCGSTFTVLFMFFHQYWFMKAITVSVDLCFSACPVVRSGNFRTGLLFGPNQSFLFLSTNNCWISNLVFPFQRSIAGLL